MDNYRKERKNAIKNIRTIEDYHAYMDRFKITPIERKIADYVFVDALSYMEISERLGYSERSVKRIMKRVLSVV